MQLPFLESATLVLASLQLVTALRLVYDHVDLEKRQSSGGIT